MQGTPPSGGGAADGPDAEARGAGRLQRQEEAGSCRGRGRVEIAAAETPAAQGRIGSCRVARVPPEPGLAGAKAAAARARPESRHPRPAGGPGPEGARAPAQPQPAPTQLRASRRAAPPPGPRPGLPVGRSSTTTGAACRKDTSTTASAASSSCDPSPPSRSAPPTPGSAGGENQPTPTDVHRRVRREAGTKWPTASFGAPPPGRHRAVGGVAGRGRVT